ncbi:ribosomal protein S18 acetylase RimI-like enzyme [Luteibacter sp. OK325]|jgi:ribosomal protein S18 acetylase RimI-like enzyme|uniref:GNAT family N-acetyltransferase n=1 Tax=unclassified Luteibacter TaxID=2620188 RepID=UPI000D3424EB|nr:GNAT family N-acetyltransferase [Luteibacter sp. OK325]PTR32454.1 ribosomal protein S18 acetylase RimI-like enzyme [Luteibacter sp. OK325]
MNSAIRVLPLDTDVRPGVLALRVQDAQLPFVGRIGDSLADVAVCPGSEALALVVDSVVVGYVRIDRRAAAMGEHPLAEGAVALRSFMIDAGRQGEGLGGRALDAIHAYVAGRHPDRERILLTVNVRNEAAVHVYRRAGYRDSGELYHGGLAGPQFVLWRPLHPWNP